MIRAHDEEAERISRLSNRNRVSIPISIFANPG